jgi:hypothetical protein
MYQGWPHLKQQIYYDIVLWGSLISMAFICLFMVYFGVTGIASHYDIGAGESVIEWAYNIAGYTLFILLPLMIAALIFSNVINSDIFEYGFMLLFFLVVLDIIVLTITYLLSG